MTFEKITITNRHVVVSYSDDRLSLTPEQEKALMDFWARRIERITRRALGDFTLGTSSGNANRPVDVPAREHESPKGPYRDFVFPFGNIGSA